LFLAVLAFRSCARHHALILELVSGASSMAKSNEEITDKAREIFKLASRSATPITIVCTQAVKLFDIEH
jgi:hypothetical protein